MEEEYRTLSALVEHVQRLTLRKSQPMKLLLNRGYSVSLDDLKSADRLILAGQRLCGTFINVQLPGVSTVCLHNA